MTDMEIVYGGIKHLKFKIGIESSSTDALWKQICSTISPLGLTVKLRRSRHKIHPSMQTNICLLLQIIDFSTTGRSIVVIAILFCQCRIVFSLSIHSSFMYSCNFLL